jgi:hypothetical protein
MNCFYVTIEQTGTASGYVFAESEESARGKAQKLLDAGTFNIRVIVGDMFDSEEIIAVGPAFEPETAELENARENETALIELDEDA